jgi:predicted glutamine amidotransferase
MCRLFAQVSTAPSSAREFLVDSEYSLLKQADVDPKNPQTDGWGLAWFDGKGAHVVKSGAPAPKEARRFADAADKAESGVVIGHIRAASKGIGIDDQRAHPFEDEGWVFAHNGTLFIRDEVAAALGPRRARLKTDSDSEVYFQQFLKHLAETGEPAAAFDACVRENWRLWDGGAKSAHPELKAPDSSLNAIASNGKGVHALCHAASKGLATHGVCHLDQPWSVMSYTTRGGRFVLASEGVDGGDWERLLPPEVVSAVPGHNGVEVRRRPLKLSNAQGPVPEVSRP